MAKKATSEKNESKELLRRMSAPSADVVEKVVPFANNDVPSYLEGLRNFEEKSRKTQIMVG